MPEDAELSYSSHEIRRVLPLGWSLCEEVPSDWKPEAGAWLAAVRDGSGLTWRVRVDADEVDQLGRSEALRRAMVRVARRT